MEHRRQTAATAGSGRGHDAVYLGGPRHPWIGRRASQETRQTRGRFHRRRRLWVGGVFP